MANKKLWTITGSLATAALLATSAGLATADNQSPASPSSTTVTTPTSPQKQLSAPSAHTASRITPPAFDARCILDAALPRHASCTNTEGQLVLQLPFSYA